MPTCKFCHKTFTKESSLVVHTCERKRRWAQEKEKGTQFGLMAYLKFYELTQGSAKTKSYADFVDSSYYSAFVKFGNYIVQVNAVNPAAFIEWIIKSGKKLDQWTKDAFYDEYLHHYLRREHPQDAIERALKEMQEWADENNSQFNHYFKYANSNKVCYHINNGRISPWVIFNCATGVAFLESLNEEQLTLIYHIIDPEYWQKKFIDYLADAEWVKDILEKAGMN
jgi:hypothetical protein